MGGGDLLNLLIERDIFEEDFTRFYVAEAGALPFAMAALLLTFSLTLHDVTRHYRWCLLSNNVTSWDLSTVTLNRMWVSLRAP